MCGRSKGYKKQKEALWKRAKHLKKEGKAVVGVPCVRDKSGVLKVQVEERVELWQEDCKKLIYVENK